MLTQRTLSPLTADARAKWVLRFLDEAQSNAVLKGHDFNRTFYRPLVEDACATMELFMPELHGALGLTPCSDELFTQATSILTGIVAAAGLNDAAQATTLLAQLHGLKRKLPGGSTVTPAGACS